MATLIAFFLAGTRDTNTIGADFAHHIHMSTDDDDPRRWCHSPSGTAPAPTSAFSRRSEGKRETI